MIEKLNAALAYIHSLGLVIEIVVALITVFVLFIALQVVWVVLDFLYQSFKRWADNSSDTWPWLEYAYDKIKVLIRPR